MHGFVVFGRPWFPRRQAGTTAGGVARIPHSLYELKRCLMPIKINGLNAKTEAAQPQFPAKTWRPIVVPN
jgi:hypothetical protein